MVQNSWVDVSNCADVLHNFIFISFQGRVQNFMFFWGVGGAGEGDKSV